MNDRIVITGIGVVSPLGIGAPAFWDELVAGRSAVAAIRGFDPGGSGPRLGAEVPDFAAQGLVPAPLLRRMDRLSRMIAVAAATALRDAALSAAPDSSRDDLGVVVGSMLGNMSESAQFLERVFTKGPALASPMLFPNLVLNAPASQVAIALASRGPNLTVCEGEISGEAALATAVGLLRRDRARAVIAAAGDELAPVVFGALRDLRYLSPRAALREWSSPFDRSANGPVMGEGAAALLLETESGARGRGARVYAEIEEVRALALAARDPHLWPAPGEPLGADGGADVLVSGADSSPERDVLELSLLSRLAERGATVYSPKGSLGENGSLGLTNVAIAALSLSSGIVPPMPALEQPREEFRFTYPRQALSGAWRRALVLGVARGGAATAIRLRTAK